VADHDRDAGARWAEPRRGLRTARRVRVVDEHVGASGRAQTSRSPLERNAERGAAPSASPTSRPALRAARPPSAGGDRRQRRSRARARRPDRAEARPETQTPRVTRFRPASPEETAAGGARFASSIFVEQLLRSGRGSSRDCVVGSSRKRVQRGLAITQDSAGLFTTCLLEGDRSGAGARPRALGQRARRGSAARP